MLQPAPHRVINADPSASRVTLSVFYEPPLAALVAPLAGLCSADQPSKVTPVQFKTQMESRVDEVYELDGLL